MKTKPTFSEKEKNSRFKTAVAKCNLKLLIFFVFCCLTATSGAMAQNSNVTISASATSGGSFTGTAPNRTFTLTADNANIQASALVTELLTNNVTIVTARTGGGQPGDVTFLTAVTAATTSTTQRTFTITAAGSITISNAINLQAASESGNNLGIPSTNITLTAGTNVSIGANISTNGGAQTRTNNNNNGGNAGSLSITGNTGITITGNVSAIGGTSLAASAGTAGNFTINNGASTVTTGGGVNDGQTSGVISGGTLTKSGNGTFVLAGVNTYTGLTTVSAGALKIQNAAALGATAAGTTVNPGAQLQIQGGITVGAEALTLSGTGLSTTGALRNISGTNTYQGLITLGAATQISSNAGSLSISNTGTITGAGFGLTIDGAGNGSIASIIGTTTGTVTKAGTGTLTLTGTNTYTGLTTVSAGVLNIQNAQGTGTTAGGVTVASGAALEVQGGITVGAEALSLNGTGISSGGALRSVGTGSLTNTWGGTITLATSGVRINTDASSTLSIGAITGTNASLFLGGLGTTTVTGAITTGTGSVTDDGPGNVIFSGTNTYSGATTIAAGITSLGASNVFANNSNLVMNGGTFKTGLTGSGFTDSMGTLTLNSDSTLAFVGSVAHTISFAVSDAVTWNGALLTVNGWNGTGGASGTAGKIVVGTTSSGLTAGQLAKFSFAGYAPGAVQLSNGEVVPTPAPVITSTLTASSTYGTASSYTITGSNTPTSYNATGLPTGISVNTTTGVITIAATTAAGSYSITISATNASGTGSATLTYTVNKASLTITAANQSVCFGTLSTTVTGAGSYNATGFVNSETTSVISGTVTYTTTYTASTAAGTSGVTITPVVSGLTATNYTFTASNGTVTVNPNPTTSNAGVDQTGASTCGLTSVTLAGNSPTVGTGAWSIVSGVGGTVTTPSSNVSTFTGTAGTTYTLRWTISNSPCTASTDDVVITFNRNPTTSNAGVDQTGASTCGLTSVTLAGNSPTVGTGAWSIVSGVGGTVTTPSSNVSTFTGTAGTTYTLRWTISNSPCTASTDDVVITFNRNPTTSNAGVDQTGASTCGLTSVTLAGNSPTVGTGAWSIVSGVGGTVTTPSSNVSTFTGTAGTTYTLRWTISNSPCTASTDDVVITFNPNLPASVSIAASATTICSGTNVTFTATPTNGGTPSYQWRLNGGNVGTNSTTYSNGALANTDVVTVVMTSFAICGPGSPATSNTITMTVNPNLPASVAIAAVPSGAICSGTSVTFTATPTNGGSTPTYQWKKGGVDISGQTSATYTSATLANSDVIAVVMTSTATPCLTGSPATSNTVTITINTPIGITAITPANTPIASGTTTTITATGVVGTNALVTWYTGANETGSIGTGLTSPAVGPGTYYAVVTGPCGSTIELATTIAPIITTTTWTSAGGGSWDNGAPTITKSAIIAHTYTSAGGGVGSFSAYSLLINTGVTVVISSGDVVTLSGALTAAAGSIVTFNSGAILLQTTDVTNSGEIAIKRDSASLMRLDYTLWSSPVVSQNLFSFSPQTLTNRFYTYNQTTDSYSTNDMYQVGSPALSSSSTFQSGRGYSIRTPNNHPTTPTFWSGQFKGTPNNGTITIPLTSTENGYALVGNPYPSPLDVNAFMDNTTNKDNTTGTVYFLRKTNSAAGSSYVSWNKGLGYVNSNGHAAENIFFSNRKINVGQGFFVKVKNSGNALVFNNSMRSGSSSNQFFRDGNTPTTTTDTLAIERSRIWLKAFNATGLESQTLLGYVTDATLSVDNGIDGTAITDGALAISTLIGAVPYTIQGRPVPFDVTDVVPLQFKATVAGTYTIGIDQVDGLFLGDQNIYLRDTQTGVDHNLKTSNYTLATEAGTFDNRFKIIFQPIASLAVSTPIFNESQVVIYKTPTNEISINTGTVVMSNVKIFDIRGRLLFEKKDINSSQTTINAGLSTEILLVQITSDEGIMVTKKVLFPRTSLKLDKKLDVKTQLAEDE